MSPNNFLRGFRSLSLLMLCSFFIALILVNYESPIHRKHFAALLKEPSYILDSIQRTRTVQCTSASSQLKVDQRGNYFVLLNFVAGSAHFECHETISFTAPADYTFLDNLLSLVHRWHGPISVAVYAPGSDFNETLRTIAHLRHCYNHTSQLIKQWVTFHVFFDIDHVDKMQAKTSILTSYIDTANCEGNAPFADVATNETFRRKNQLFFPINVARNIARQAARTHYVLAADVELYPSENFIRDFMQMLENEPHLAQAHPPRVFALAIFELKENISLPENKTQLLDKYEKKEARLFHQYICSICHRTPNFTQWLKTKETKELTVFVKGKRLGPQRMWEAFYVGTKADPLFDERLTWEGQGNKMSQGFAMCLMDYDYLVLNNAFLVHKPGLKKRKEQVQKFQSVVSKSNWLLKRRIKPQLIRLYGFRSGCVL